MEFIEKFQKLDGPDDNTDDHIVLEELVLNWQLATGIGH